MLGAELTIGAIVAVAILLYLLVARSSQRKADAAAAVLDDVSALGDDLVPASIHPKIDPDRCMGSGACVRACPEHDVIGLVGGRVELINPLACVGHGACAAACPMDAIELVFGTARRGIELPVIDERFETNQPGIYVVGELGGMGLIRNAVRQGMEAGEYIARSSRRGDGGQVYDAVIVGAGPAGTSATLSLMQQGLRVLLLERETFGGTIQHYPRAKVVMTGTLEFPGYRKVRKRTMSKEDLVELWDDIRASTQLPIRIGELVEAVEPEGGHWRIRTTGGEFMAANVVLALGRRGSPRKLGVPGEEAPKVVYRLLEPEVFDGKRVLVVGGGNAAAECALALADAGGCARVAISYRRAEFARLRGQVRDRLESCIASGRIDAFLSSQVAAIADDSVTLSFTDGRTEVIDNDSVVVQIGGTPPSKLLSAFGIDMVEKRGER
jgi:thioredoxin reductase/NAD-dependent dihydropyrimidine dehydrogenase PreA subunit